MSRQNNETVHVPEHQDSDATSVQWIELSVPQRHVKRIKTALETRNWLNRKRGIARQDTGTDWDTLNERYMRISTTVEASDVDLVDPGHITPSNVTFEYMIKTLDLDDIKGEIKPVLYAVLAEDLGSSRGSPFSRNVKKSLEALPPDLLHLLGDTIAALVEQFPSTYTIYRPMLLLPRNDYTSLYGSTVSKALLLHSPEFKPFWERLAASVDVTHIAINAGIPLDAAPKHADGTPIENVFRSPINLTPMYGCFGPAPSAQTLTSPATADFDAALWVTHTQNGIRQTWAPLYTMFSRGNIREKTRLLHLPSVAASVARPEGCTAVDLYAGIGYFVFPYRKAGVNKVLCWEVNPWSIEGLQRGAGLNGMRTQVVRQDQASSEALSESTDIVIFAHSNEYALDDLAETQRAVSIPPIRHVNCGFLPSSSLSWKTAVGMVDRELGGWIHAHENVGVNDIEQKTEQVVQEIQAHMDAAGRRGQVRCEHVEKVKTYAPGVLHAVFDIWISGASGPAAS